MTGQSLGFVVIETSRQEGQPDDVAMCFAAGAGKPLVPDEETARRARDRFAAHAVIDADLYEGITFEYSVAEVVSR